MSLRSSLKRLAERATSTTILRERAGVLRSDLEQSTQQTSRQSRRAVMAGSLAAAVPLSASADPEAIPSMDAAFIALAPKVTPLIRRLIVAQAEMTRLHIEAEAEAGDYPGYRDEGHHRSWSDRIQAAREANGSKKAWSVANTIERELTDLVEGFEGVPMSTLSAILLKVALHDLGEWWSESATDDLRRLANARFDLPPDSAQV